jgi:hypothetical protein
MSTVADIPKTRKNSKIEDPIAANSPIVDTRARPQCRRFADPDLLCSTNEEAQIDTSYTLSRFMSVISQQATVAVSR